MKTISKLRECICRKLNARRWDVDAVRSGKYFYPVLIYRKTKEAIRLRPLRSMSRTRALMFVDEFLEERIIKRSDFD